MIQKHPNHIALGIGMMMIGMWLIMNNHFFMWPPDSVEFANDDIWGGIFILIGFSLTAWDIDGHESIKWNRRLLSIAAGAMAFLTAYQFIIWAATGMYYSWISNSIITAFMLIMALKGAINTDYLSDGAHTFGELYYHRAVLFALLLNKYTSGTYRSKLHRDGTMFEGMFIVDIKTPAGHYSYHFPLDYWDLFEEIPVNSFAPTYDGHKPEGISRLFSL